MSSTSPGSQWLYADGPVASAVMRAPWSHTSLGPISHWTASQKTLVNTILASPLPTLLLWGRDLLQIYNDAYAQIMGGRHPCGVGQKTADCWPETWHFHAPIYARVFDGEHVHIQDQEFLLDGPDGPEAHFFSVAYSPARDDAGAIFGVIVITTDSTSRIRMERLTSALLSKSVAARQQMIHLFKQAPGFMVMLRGPEFIVELANDAYLSLAGVNNIIGKKLKDAIPAAQQQGFTSILDEVFATGRPFVADHMPIQLPRGPDGAMEQRFLDFVYQPLRDTDGQVHCILVEGNDVTEQYLASAELARVNQALGCNVARLEAGERRQRLLARLSDSLRSASEAEVATAACELTAPFLGLSGMVSYAVQHDDPGLQLEWQWRGGSSAPGMWMARSLDDFGPGKGEMLREGHSFRCSDTASDPGLAAHCAQFGVGAVLVIPLLQAGRLAFLLVLHTELPRPWADEDVALAAEVAQRTCLALEAARTRAQPRLEHDLSRHIFDSMPEGFGMLDRDWRVIYMNPEGLRLGQRCAAEALGHDHWEVWPEVRGTALEAAYRRVARSGMPETLEQLVSFDPERSLWLELRVQRTRAGELVILFHDITERKALDQAMQDVSRHKDEFLATLAHELRNPLAPICASADLLTQSTYATERVKKVGAIIRRQSNIMRNLIDDLLDVSRVTQGFVTLNMVAVDTGAVLQCALEQVAPALASHGHVLSTDLPAAPLWVAGDAARLVQVVANLLSNAIKYTHGGGSIGVRIGSDGVQVLISVSDTGIGMPHAFLAKAFDLFSQAERTPDRIQGGLGIGLSLVRSLVQLHHGKVTAESDGPGRGSRFTVSLPRIEAPPID